MTLQYGRRKLIQIFSKINSSYWFIPAVLIILSVALCEVMISIDQEFGIAYLKENGIKFFTEINGSYEILATIATSMITVAGVTFSMTLLSVSHASSQIGPRILSDFMKDRGNQVTLGVFISTFSYCLLVMKNVKMSNIADSSEFIPHLSVYVAILLAFLSLSVLVYFINHVSKSINMTLAISKVGDNLLRSIERTYQFSESIDYPAEKFNQSSEIKGKDKGYLRYIDRERLLKIATECKLHISVEVMAGDFIYSENTLAKVISNSNNLTNDLQSNIRECFVWGAQKTINQDTFFSIDLLIEVIARALSTGVNDPYSAIECLDQITAAMHKLLKSNQPIEVMSDKMNEYFVYFKSITTSELLDRTYRKLIPYVTRDKMVSDHLLNNLISLRLTSLDEDIRLKISELKLLITNSHN